MCDEGKNTKAETVGDRIKIIRRGLGLKQSEFAQLLEIRQASVSNLERNVRSLSGDVLKKLCKLGYPAEWILEGQTSKEFSTEKFMNILNRLGIPNVSTYNGEIFEIVEMLRGLSPRQLTYIKGVITGLKGIEDTNKGNDK